jgi:hypothetical protein
MGDAGLPPRPDAPPPRSDAPLPRPNARPPRPDARPPLRDAPPPPRDAPPPPRDAPPQEQPPTPVWKRWWSWLAVVLVLVAIGIAVGGSSGDEERGSGCLQASAAWADQLDMSSGAYVYADAGTASNGMEAWVVKKDDGAIWATDVDPSTPPSSGGLVVPLNEQARQDSIAGVDLSDEAIAGLFPDASVDAVADCG